MIINPIEELLATSESIVDANKKRIEKIKNVSNEEKEELFQKLKIDVEKKEIPLIKFLLENRLFFEIIEDEFIEKLVKIYHNINMYRKIEYINCLKESYKLRGVKGIVFAFGGIIKRFDRLTEVVAS